MTTVDPIESYVGALGRQLRGPWRARRGLLREVRDGLDDAAGAFVEEGHPQPEARQLAVEEFGPVAALAPEFQRELAVMQARRTAAWAALVMPTLWLAWDLTWANSPDVGVALPAVMVLARVTDVLGIGTALLCLAALLVMELRGGRLHAPERLARAVSRAVLAGVLGVMAASVAMTTLNMKDALAVTEGSLVYRMVTLASVAATIVVLRSAIRCGQASVVEFADPPTVHELVVPR